MSTVLGRELGLALWVLIYFPLVSILIGKTEATSVLLAEAVAEERGDPVPLEWQRRIEALSKACEKSSKTHIAVLGTALLAKATVITADPFALKEGAPTYGAYSARGLSTGVLVPKALTLGIHLGVTGREPHNNQPYFRAQRATLEELLPLIKGNAVVPVRKLVECLEELEKLTVLQEARDALRAFIRVRRTYQSPYPTAPKTPPRITPRSLLGLVEKVVGADPEGGKRAQAVAAGILDAVVGEALVLVARVNDPDRQFPGDVGVLQDENGENLACAFEVRDKRVSADDLLLFGKKLALNGVRRGAVLCVANMQARILTDAAEEWSSEQGVHLVVFFSWHEFLKQALLWCQAGPSDPTDVATRAYTRSRERLLEMEVSPSAITMWDKA